MRGQLIAAAFLSVSVLSGCASGDSSDQPAWFAERQAGLEQSFPSLRDVPRDTRANTDPAYWASAQAELEALGAAVRSNPRSQPVTAADDPNVFLEEARRDLERARLAHEPN